MVPWKMSNARVGGRAGRIAFWIAGLALGLAGPVRPVHVAAQAAPVDIHLQVRGSDARDRARMRSAADESLLRYAQWLGPLPLAKVTIVGRPWQQPVRHEPGTVVIDPPWHSAPPVMDIESQVAYGVALQYWRAADPPADSVPIAASLSWYLQSRVVEGLFNVRYAVTAHSTESVGLFGGHVPWAFPTLRLSRWSAGLGRDRFVQSAGARLASPVSARRLPPGLTQPAVRGALALGALERYLGWPVLQGALHTLATSRRGVALTVSVLDEVISAAACQDLSWFFDGAFNRTVDFAYAIDAVSSRAVPSCESGPCHRTEVTLARRAPGQFTGTSRAPVGPYEAGDGLALRVTFEDGQIVTARWDGRAATRTLAFESPAPLAAVRLDPEGVLLLDDTPLDHVRAASPRSNTPIAKWAARWTVWLQNALLTYAMLV